MVRTAIGVYYMGYTLAPPGKYDWTVRVRQRCRLMSSYSDHLVLLDRIAHTTYVDVVYCYWPSSVVYRSVTLVSPAKKWANQSRCSLGWGLGWAQKTMY